MSINFNKAATSEIKPQMVIDAVNGFMSANSFQSVGRGGGELESMEGVLSSRIAVAELLSQADCRISPNEVIFSSGATESLNILIGGLSALECPHVIITCFEHNSVARPVYALSERGLATMSVLGLVGDDGRIMDEAGMLGALKKEIGNAPKGKKCVFICTNASNVFGNVLPVESLFGLSKQYGIYNILDTAQTLGHTDVKLTRDLDALVFTGHKGLKGLPGSGGFVIKPSFADLLASWKLGGTGSTSHLLTMPDFLPDKFECGTPNTLGIAALGAAAKYVAENLRDIEKKEFALYSKLIAELRKLPLKIYADDDYYKKMPVISFTVDGYDSSVLAGDLEEGYGIFTRTGLHCAPLAHTAMGTMPEGTLRISFNSDNTFEEIEIFIDALKMLMIE